jgi:4-amino-4-deoxy-L-arabinose transferase-like glycosyltransferase
LLGAAAIIHLVLAVGLFWAGRTQVAPSLIDRDGIISSFAFDSYEYQRGAAHLGEVLKQSGVREWASEREPLHAKLISLEFALLGPLFGDSVLSAEPLNLLSYLAIVALVFLLGREVGGRRVGLFSAGAVALWPTFLLHTLQLLKDPFFIAGVLALILCVATWLTRTYSRRAAVGVGALMSLIIILLLLIRLNFGIAFLALVLLGLVLLIIRQLRERRLLFWNMACPLVFLLGAFVLIPFATTHRSQKFKHYPSDQIGQPKAVANAGGRMATVISYRPRVSRPGQSASRPFVGPLLAATDRAAQRVSNARTKFAAFYPDAGSGIDRDVEFRTSRDLILYLPRAFVIGWWAPFPNTWIAAGRRVGSAGKLVSGVETLIIYVCQLLALLAILCEPRSLASWLLLSLITLGVTALGLVVPNVGALYRFRYTFWILLIILGMKGLETVMRASGRWLRRRQGVKMGEVAAGVLLACLLATTTSCSSRSDSTGGEAADASRTREAQSGTTALPATSNQSLAITNSTGASIRALYLSPSDSTGWEENLLDGEEFSNGNIIDIPFNSEERAVLWDLRVEGTDERYAEWKGLDLREISSINLLLSLDGEAVVIAELE